jgi:starvation-inducible outer membrane lipoprotein
MSQEEVPYVSTWIEATENKKIGDNIYTLYKVVVQTKYDKWVVDRRFSEFYDLHQALKKKFPSAMYPEFPNKTLFGNMSDTVIEARKKVLDNYMKKNYSATRIIA